MKKRTIAILLIYLLMFVMLFFLVLYDLNHKIMIFDIGLNYYIINIIVLITTFFGIIKTVWHIYTY
ncbi:hypothetical protein HN827_00690 [archaeon]|jgi:hypothetical protein|nr:hypothetical protein [archaeon]MBT4647699.1 hypothetical protein [archaeon]MBT6822371.1 hypothetical protein [archaeon]MBT7391316.1 hypothetical protein [archaeon]